jgi:hypothetical protein
MKSHVHRFGSLMPMLTTKPIFFLIAECVAFCPNFGIPHTPYLTIDQFIFHHLIYFFDACVGIGSVQMQNRPHNKGLTMSKMPPMATSGKLANASKRKHARQVLKSEQRQHDHRELLSSIGKNSAPDVFAPPPSHHLVAMKGTPLTLLVPRNLAVFIYLRQV